MLAGGQVVRQSDGERACPDGCRNSRADGGADAGEHAQDRQDDGDILVLARGHDGHLLADNQSAAGKGDEDLAHDYQSDIPLRLPEVDHQADAQDLQWKAEVQRQPLEAAAQPDQDADDEPEEGGADGVDVADVGGLRDAQAVHDLQVGGKVAVPAVVADEERGREDARADHSPVGQQREGDEGLWRPELFVDREQDQQQAADDNHADYQRRAPAQGLVGV